MTAIVDAHVHLLPGRLAAKVRAFFDARLGGPTPFAYPLDHGTVLGALAADGVGEAWSLPYAHKPGVAVGLNESSAATAAASVGGPVLVVPGATVHPADDDPAGIVRSAVDRLGLRVLKLHCSVGSFDIDDRRLEPVFELATERRLPVVVHLGHDASGRTTVAELDGLDRVAARHPSAPIVLAHCGFEAATEALVLLDAHPSLLADLTPVGANPVVLDARDVARFADRLLFGSDAPNTYFAVGVSVERIRGYGLAGPAEAAVLGGNARRLQASVVVS